MVTHLLDGALVRRVRAAGGWSLTSIECDRGLARVEQRAAVTEVVIGDHDLDRDGDLSAFTAAACTADGEALVISRQAPPAFLLTPRGARATPADGGPRGTERPNPDERLLMLSCAAFESMPELLASGIHGSPHELLSRDAEDLLLALFRDIGRGAGAVIERPHPTFPQGGPL